LTVLLVFLSLLALGCTTIGAIAIVQPHRRQAKERPELPYEAFSFSSQGLRLEGWRFPTQVERRGVIVYLHGIGNNRRAGIDVARRLGPLGYEVVAYDARAHGRSQGKYCTYGYYEKDDFVSLLDALQLPRAILIGHSLGAAVALQAASIEPRIQAVVALSTFSDLPSIIEDRKPWLLRNAKAEELLEEAAKIAHFPPQEASPLAAAPLIRAPVLLIHGADDDQTPPSHSRRVFEQLTCRRKLVILEGVGHRDILDSPRTWQAIEQFLSDLADA
jgi:pimeloyl-ACP methyl ester carboxylesterase